MTRKTLLTGPSSLALEAMHLAHGLDIQIISAAPHMPVDELTAIRKEQQDSITVRQGKLTSEMIEAASDLAAIAKLPLAALCIARDVAVRMTRRSHQRPCAQEPGSVNAN
jgi:hypothetical protein